MPTNGDVRPNCGQQHIKCILPMTVWPWLLTPVIRRFDGLFLCSLISYGHYSLQSSYNTHFMSRVLRIKHHFVTNCDSCMILPRKHQPSAQMELWDDIPKWTYCMCLSGLRSSGSYCSNGIWLLRSEHSHSRKTSSRNNLTARAAVVS